MIHNTSSLPASGRQHQRRAFTLVEMMFAVAVSGIIMVSIVTTYVFCIKGFRSLSNYTEIHADARKAIDWFSRDARVGIGIESSISNQIVLVVPTLINNVGVVTDTKLVTHSLIDSQWHRIDSAKSNDTTLAENLDSIEFILYDRVGNITTQVNQAVSLEVNASMTKTVMNQIQSHELVSGRMRMRNVQ